MSAGVLVATYAAGILASLPVMFVPFIALFDGAGLRTAFAQSFAAFARNPGPLLLFGALSFALLMLGLATSGFGSAAGVALVRRGVVRGVEGDLQRRVTAARVGAFLQRIWSFVRYVEKLQWLG